MAQARAESSRLAAVLRVTSGNFLEMFDFFLFGFYATAISRTFFPTGSEFASLMLTFGTFGAGFSLAYSLATAVFGGFTPAVSTWLIDLTGNKAAPGWWMMFAAACGLAGTLFLYGRRPPGLPESDVES